MSELTNNFDADSDWAETGQYTDAVALVTGGYGFIGSAIVQRLLAAGAEVHVLARSSTCSEQLTTHAGDVADRRFVRATFLRIRPDYVFHLAGRTNAAKDLKHVIPTLETNAVGTVNVLLAAAESAPECRLVACASMNELWHDDVQASSPYAISKFVATSYVAMFNALYGLKAVSLTTFFVYGPGPQPSEKLMPQILRALQDHQVPVLNTPNRAMDWVYVEDVAEAFLRAGLSHAALSLTEPIAIGSGSLHTIAEVVQTLASLMGRQVDPARLESAAATHEVSPLADTLVASRLLGWRARTSLREGLERTATWYRSRP